MKLIPLDAVLAEIESLLDKGKYHEEYDCAYHDGNNGALYALKGKVNSLEVKEVDLGKLIQESFIYHESHGDDFRSDCQIETAFRTGFEDGFKCKGYISKIQVNNLKEEIKRYFNEQPIMTRSKGVDYKLIPSAEKIAKHFFELGVKVAQKGEEVY